MRNTYRYRSFFWPAVLILAGVIALLVNTGQLPVERLGDLVSLWPVVLIVLGLELIVRRTMHGAPGDVAAALIVILAIAGAAAYVAVAPIPSATHSYEAAGPGGPVEQASVQIDVGAATIEVTSAAEQLYHVHVDYSGDRPDVEYDSGAHALRISQTDRGFTFFQNRKFNLKLQLNVATRWAIETNSGAATVNMNLAQTHISSLKLNTGASKDEITLGAPTGTVPVEINGGALTVRLHRPSGAGATIEVSGGAVTLDADGHTTHAVGHASYQTAAAGSDLYQITVDGGACTVTLDTGSPSG